MLCREALIQIWGLLLMAVSCRGKETLWLSWVF